MPLLDPPVSVLLALWAPSPSSFGPAVVQGADAVHEVVDGASHTPLGTWLEDLRPLVRAAAVLPGPGEALPGLGAALEAGEGVILEQAPISAPSDARQVLLVPRDAPGGLQWLAQDLPVRVPPFDATQARRDVHAATEQAIEALVALDLARERPDLADTLNDLVTAVLDPRVLPPGLGTRQRELTERSLRLLRICELALTDDGAAATAAQAREREAVLRPLHAVARRGVAAGSQTWGPAARR